MYVFSPGTREPGLDPRTQKSRNDRNDSFHSVMHTH